MTKNDLITLHDLNKTYAKPGQPPIRAINNVSLTIGAGDFVAVLGVSGSGKSTLMNVLGLLDRADSGEYRLDGTDVGQMSENDLARFRSRSIGYVFQAYHLLPRTTAIENLFLPLLYARERDYRRKSEAALAAVGLGDRMNHKVDELSGGQQQRVAIARAIVNDPRILLADEPTGNLDPDTTMEIMEVLKARHRLGTTLILITHNLDLAAMADRVIHIANGAIASDSGNPSGR